MPAETLWIVSSRLRFSRLRLAIAMGALLSGSFLGSRAGSAPEPAKGAAVALQAETNLVAAPSLAQSTNLWRLEVAHAVMVTVELDLGSKVPKIEEALAQIERRTVPVDGVGRTFAILDAYGEPTADGKLHISMHVSAEKPGEASLVFKRTGEVLWHCQIVQGESSPSAVFAKKGLIILMDDGAGHTVTIDGSKNPRSILDAVVKEMVVPVREIWPEGGEREMSFLYSACGCPVNAKAVRSGDKTIRTSEMPVIFPDDPAVAAVIKKLMVWE